MTERLIFERSRPGVAGVRFPALDVEEVDPASVVEERLLRREPPRLPEVAENEVVRHFVRLSTLNHHVDKRMYPLGSCTMKYNPKVNEDVARLPGFAALHPAQDPAEIQGALELMHELGEMLKEIVGMDAITLQPAAGSQGELTGLLLIRAYHESRGDPRKRVLIPDSAHGTNPATVVIGGYEVVTLRSNERGQVDPAELERHLDGDVAALMLTNPNTLGKFEREILRITALCHEAGAQVYMDGANMNALLGIARPGDMGYDVCHLNLHKTFSTPHGGGGPGSGPVAVRKHLEPFLPHPLVVRRDGAYALDDDRPRSIGKVHSFFGNFGMHVRAYTYIRMHGAEGLREVSETAILNANYLRGGLADLYDLPYGPACMHEVVFSGDRQKKKGVKTLDIAKRLLDFGFHAPTTYFPLIVSEALMIEPTETESKAELDAFIETMREIDREAGEDPARVRGAPYTTPVGRIDEGRAGRELDVRWLPGGEAGGAAPAQAPGPPGAGSGGPTA
ncbi:MAG: aminomethyl-transferring glycine dehydrogenase subunit GcvPB [Gemmatimonadota bacterium]